MKRQVTDWDKTITKHVFDKQVLSRIYVEHLQLN